MDKNYNLGITKKYEKDKIIIKPILVNDTTSYKEFCIFMDESRISILKKKEQENEILIIPYDKNKKLIEI